MGMQLRNISKGGPSRILATRMLRKCSALTGCLSDFQQPVRLWRARGPRQLQSSHSQLKLHIYDALIQHYSPPSDGDQTHFRVTPGASINRVVKKTPSSFAVQPKLRHCTIHSCSPCQLRPRTRRAGGAHSQHPEAPVSLSQLTRRQPSLASQPSSASPG